MKGITINIHLEKYLEQWAVRLWGNPIRFFNGSIESLLLVQLLSRKSQRPSDWTDQREGTVAVYIPDNAAKRPEYYNYLSPRAERELVRQIRNLFTLHLWNAIAPYAGGKHLNTAICDWCSQVGIEAKYHDTVRQRFYRLRTHYYKYGVVLGVKYGNKAVRTKAGANKERI